jgi:hypothetical protein
MSRKKQDSGGKKVAEKKCLALFKSEADFERG